jgi:hypothetical protein
MNARLAFAWVLLLGLFSSASAQSACTDCLNVAEEELGKCLGNAFSAEDKSSCEQRRHARIRACVTGVCAVEREERAARESRTELQAPLQPGRIPYTPTRIEWLALVLNAELREPMSAEHPYSLAIVAADHETLAILVRHQPNVNREAMTRSLAAARTAILSRARRYGWDTWVKIQELVEPEPSQK